MSRYARFGLWILGGFIAGIGLAGLAILLLTRTDWGLERARGFAVGWLEDRVTGELRIGRVSGASLLNGVTIHDLSIHDDNGRPFVIADSVAARYDWRNLVRGDIVIDAITLYSPQLYMEKLAGDTLWNYQHIFADTTPDEPPGSRRLIMFEDAHIVDGLVVVRRPWEPEGSVEPADTARLILEDAPGGLLEAWRFEDVNGELDRVVWESPIEHGKLFQARTLSTLGFLWKDPFELRDARGTLTLVDSVVAFEFPELRLPATLASAVGRMAINEGRNNYDVRFESSDVDFADLQWLYPPLPEDAAGSMVMHIQTQLPKGTLFLAEDADIKAPGTQMAGTLGIVLGDTLYFTRVDMRASPLDVELLERVLPGELPVEGLLVGTVEVSGPISALETRGDLRLTSGLAAGSAVRWDGVLDLRAGRRGVATRRLTAELTSLDLSLLDGFTTGLPFGGVIDGRLEASGRLDRALRIDGELRHQAGGRPGSVVEGGGTVYLSNGDTFLDFEIGAAALALEEIATLSPVLAGLHGIAHGTIRLSGPLDRLGATADLITPAGGLGIETWLMRDGGEGGIAATGQLTNFQLRELSDDLPDAALSGHFGIDLRGGGLASMRGDVRFDLDSARFAALPIGRATLRGALDSGLLRIDTLVAAAPGVDVFAHGELGLVDGRAGDILVEAHSASLEPLEFTFFKNIVDPTTPRLGGAGRATGTVSGSVSNFRFDANGALDDFVYDRAAMDRVTLRAAGELVNGDLRLDADARTHSLRVPGRDVDSATIRIDHDAGVTNASAAAWRAGQQVVLATGSASSFEEETAVRIGELTLGSGDSAWSLAGAATLSFAPLGVHVNGFELRNAAAGATLRAGGTLAWLSAGVSETDPRAPPLDFTIDASRIPFADVVRLARNDADASGFINGHVNVAGHARTPEVRGDLRIDALRYENAALDQVGVRLDYGESRVDAWLDGFHGDRRVVHAEGRVPLDLRFASSDERRLDAPLELTLQADSLPAGLVLALFESFRDVEGVIDGTLSASGTTLAPEFGGALALRRGELTWDALGVRYENASGTLSVEPGRTTAVDLSASTSDPRTGMTVGRGGRVTGNIDLSTLTDPGLDLVITADRLLGARRRDVELTLSGRIAVGGRYRAPEISGNARVDGGTLYLDEIYRQYLVVGLEDPVLFQVVDTSLVSVRQMLPPTENPFLRNLVVRDATVTVGAESWLRSREMNIELRGDLSIDFNRQREDIRLTGVLDVVRGTYRFDHKPFARVFDVREGTVEFAGTPGIDPNLDITAAYRARAQDETLDILARLTGTLESPRVRLTSDAEPPISESDLASYLFFGVPTYAFGITRPGSGDTGSDGGDRFGRPFLEAAASAYGVGYVAGGLQTLAQTYGLADYVGLSVARNPGFGANGTGGLFRGTELELGRYITPRTYVAWTSPLRTPGQLAGFRLEWQFHPKYRMETFAEDRFAGSPFGLGSTIEPRKVLGLFLLREWGY